ncbi:Zinc finger protein 64 [Plakobranchus ocellatus]|uniref:Zinc finger protein 64 n=1 Tax=Plakobranchus ocellatus TaxID=259542 RepID=A0AAV4DT05_9GAST|nr:Zinc finger protein 64 [Plakobranchus ocellatus]
MTKPVLTCDICKFKGSNAYIFRRHLHRCYSLHGIASKRSSPRNPLRLKGTENLSIKPINSNSQENVESDSEKITDITETVEEGVTKAVDGAVTQWGVSDSPLTVSTEQGDDTVDTSSHKITDKSSDNIKTGVPYARHYRCNECSYESKNAKEFLYHLRDEHGNPSKIHECNICDYASRYHNKVERHMAVHKLAINMDDRKAKSVVVPESEFGAESASLGETNISGGEDSVRAGGRLRVKPLKLTRLNIKMPFKVSEAVSDSRSPPQLSPSNGDKEFNGLGSSKLVYKRVKRGDGSHIYQCSDCLYYAQLISKVKKHHSLCHGKLLRCPHCDVTTTGQGILYEHLITHSGHGYVQCPDCSYVTNAKSNYEKHRTFHEAVFPYNCSVCSFGADSENKIKRHVTTQHTATSGTLGTDSQHDEQMDTGQDSNTEIESNLVRNQKDPSEDNFLLSKSKGQKVSGGPLPKIEYKCPKCVMVCYRRGNFTRHLTARHGYSQRTASQLSKSMENRMFKSCKQRVVPGGQSVVTESLKCPRCSYMAKWPSDLRRHMQVHTVLKRFKCSICPNKYKYLGDLNVHVRRDHNMEPVDTVSQEVTSSFDVIKKASPAIFRCPICKFSCHNKGDLEQHSRTHSNITKTYQCRLCDYQTYWRGDVGRHLFRHHEVVLSKDALEIDEYFILRPDIRPLTKQGPSSAMSTTQAVFPGNPEPPEIADPSKYTEESLEQLQDKPDQLESREGLNDDNALNTSGGLKSEVSAAQPLLSLGPVCLKDGSFVCEFPNCDFKSTISDRMEVHLGLHLNIKMFMCPTCGKRTNWKWDVVKHMNKFHKNPNAAIEDVITLSMEEAKATIGQYLATFEKRSREITINHCSLCEFKSLEKNRVVRHMGTVHKNQNGKVISRVLENPQDVEATNGGLEINDMKLSPPISASSLDDKKSGSPAKFQEPSPEELAKYEKPYACAICKKGGVTKGDVKKHYNYTHPYKDVRVVFVGDGTEFNYYSGEIYSKNFKSYQGEEIKDVNGPSSGDSLVSLFSGKPVRPDSKYSNPKMHGYVKPFKCSICGIRSNWKWDLKKHLRSKHPGGGGFVIMLSIEEASQTYGKECSPSHPAVPLSRPSPIPGRSSPFAASPVPSPTLSSNHVFKSPLNIKEERLTDSNDSSDTFIRPSFLQKSPHLSCVSSVGKVDRSTFPDPSRRQWKCSGCDYISNWRRNMARHIHRKHPLEKHSIRVLPLHKMSASQLASLSINSSIASFFPKKGNSSGNNTFNGTNNMGATGSAFVEKSNTSRSKQSHLSGMKVWKCPRCPFKSVLRTHIMGHMQQHGIKPFKCGVCHLPFMNRGPLHKHLQKVHKCGDYIRQCKVVITYDGEEDDDSGPTEKKETTEHGNDDSDQRKIMASTNDKKALYVNSFFCRLCNLEYSSREETLSHLEAVHNSVENDNNVLKIQKRVNPPTAQDSFSSLSSSSINNGTSADLSLRGSSGRKLHFCHVCPYRTQKKQMLAFHMTYHRPTVSNRFKCKYCPYYVSTIRLLHQHQRKWHEGGAVVSETTGPSWNAQGQRTPPISPIKTGSPGSGSGRRHMCEKCPYTTNSKNDFIYHKQFHRPKRSAEYKCEYCDYWVVHKRLLKQHVRLHTKHSQPDVSNLSSPAKSLYSDPGLVYDPAELTELAAIKQKMISAKVTASLSQSPAVSPMKLASSLSAENGKPNYVMKNGMYRKLHKCKRCPYTNVRARNMQLHEMMHGPRQSPHPLMKCPYCDYYVGSKGLLSHHMKVHQKSYGDTPENDAEMAELGLPENAEESDQEILPEQKVDTLLQISRFKRFGCDRCPYASAKRQHFERHLQLHGSRQRYTCQYCDYSVPFNNLLLQHTKLHMMPNQNLLASQSITNLHHLSEVPADVALASALPPADTETTVTISVIHDHLGLYENNIYDSEPKKLYRCDRCPYANIRRDYLLSHLKFHMVTSAFACPYCDYSAPKQSLLTQHVRVHFCPLPELSDWLLENGQTERETSHRQMDLGEALKVARDYQMQTKSKPKLASEKTSLKNDQFAGKENVQRTEYVDRNKKEIEKAENDQVTETLQAESNEVTPISHTESTESIQMTKMSPGATNQMTDMPQLERNQVTEISQIENSQATETSLAETLEKKIKSEDQQENCKSSNLEEELSSAVVMNGKPSHPDCLNSSGTSCLESNEVLTENLDDCTEKMRLTDDMEAAPSIDNSDVSSAKESVAHISSKEECQPADTEAAVSNQVSSECADSPEDISQEVQMTKKRVDEVGTAEVKDLKESELQENVMEKKMYPIQETNVEDPPQDNGKEKVIESDEKMADAGKSDEENEAKKSEEGSSNEADKSDLCLEAHEEKKSSDSAASVDDSLEKELLEFADGEPSDSKAEGLNITDQDDKLLEEDD